MHMSGMSGIICNWKDEEWWMNVFETQRYQYRSSQAIKENSFLKIKWHFP